MVNSENDAGPDVWYSASAAAIFIGCCSVMMLGLEVAGDRHEGPGDDDDPQRRAACCGRNTSGSALAGQMPGADAEHEGAGGEERRR